MLLGPEFAHHLDLLFHPSAAVRERHVERRVLRIVPANTDAKLHPSPTENIYLGGLFSDEHRLALRQYHHRRLQPERRSNRCTKRQHRHRFVIRKLGRIVRSHCEVGNRRPGLDDVVGHVDKAVTQLFCRLQEIADGCWVMWHFWLRKVQANIHCGYS